MKRKIAIQSLPLTTNYGGILQAFALQYWLEKRGYDVVHLQRKLIKEDVVLKIKRFAYRIVYWEEIRVKRKVQKIFNRFIFRYISQSKSLNSKIEWDRFVSNNKFNAVIVGSDQVCVIDNLQKLF